MALVLLELKSNRLLSAKNGQIDPDLKYGFSIDLLLSTFDRILDLFFSCIKYP
jgi:hypothetical protein